MKRLFASAIAALLCSSSAAAQTPTDKPAEAQGTEVRVVIGNEHKHAREADARHCLDLKDERAIIRCAERYRHRAAR